MILFLQQGGHAIAPLVSYEPVTVTGGRESAGTAASAASSGNSSDLTDKDFLKMIDKLEGLPNDANAVILQLQNFYVNLSHSLIPSTSSIEMRYLSAVGQLNNLKFNRKLYDEAYKVVSENGGLNEFAIDANGKLIAINKDMDIKYVSPSEVSKLPEGYQLLRNSELLSLRANSPNLVGNNGILDLVKNGIGMESVTKMIKDSMVTLGTQTSKLEGYARTSKDNLISGLEAFLKAQQESGQYNTTVDNLYKGSYLTKSLADQAKLALSYIYRTLPNNAKTLLKTKTGGGTDEEALELVGTLIGSGLSSTNEFTLDMDSASAAKVDAKRKENGIKDGTELESNLLLLMQEGAGGSGTTMSVDRGNGIRMTVNGTYYGLIKTTDGKPIQDTSLANMIAESGIQSMVNNTRNITFGDLKITPLQLSQITYNNTGCVRANLPVKEDGSINLEILDEYNLALSEIKLLGPNPKQSEIAKIYRSHDLDNLLKANGELNENKFAPFIVTEGYTTSANGIKDTDFVKEVKDAGEDVFNLIKKSLTVGTGKDKEVPDIDEFSWWNPADYFGNYDKIYKAAIYIPITTNVNASLTGANKSIDYDESQRLEAQHLTLKKRLNVNKNNSADLL